jgi:hypothetical protein
MFERLHHHFTGLVLKNAHLLGFKLICFSSNISGARISQEGFGGIFTSSNEAGDRPILVQVASTSPSFLELEAG